MTPTAHGSVDDMGVSVHLSDPPRRVISLVPSLTEALATSVPDLLVGATDWCTHPAGLEVTRVRGTKNPDLAAIVALAPDLVIANKEENRELDVRRLRERGINVWVTVTESVPEALDSMERLFTIALSRAVPGWLVEARAAWGTEPPEPVARVAVAIWRDPWMVVGSSTFTGDLLRRVGLSNVFDDATDRYPAVSVSEIEARQPDVVLLPDEPYVFTADDGPEAFSHTRTELTHGRLLTWYGPALVEAHAALSSQARTLA